MATRANNLLSSGVFYGFLMGVIVMALMCKIAVNFLKDCAEASEAAKLANYL